jgi:hypothetical protein
VRKEGSTMENLLPVGAAAAVVAGVCVFLFHFMSAI